MWCTSYYNHYITTVLIYCSLCSGTNVVTKATPAKAVDKLKMKVEISFKGLKAIVADRDGPFITTEVSGKLFHYTSMNNIPLVCAGLQVSGTFSKTRKELCAR